MPYTYHILDVFTRERFLGNPLAIVSDADTLTDAQMQAIAREFNLSETVFLLAPVESRHSAQVRIFTPAREMVFAGHPTVGAACLLASQNGVTIDGEQDAIITLEEGIGPVRVGVRRRRDEPAFGEFDLPQLPEDAGATAPRDAIAAALGLEPTDIGFENHFPTRYSAGNPFTFVPVHGLDAIGRATMNLAHWKEGFRGDELCAAYLYCRETQLADAAFHARMFVPGQGIGEDPATGSAAAAFAGVVAHFDEPTDGLHRMVIEQGYEMGRASQIHLEVEMQSGRLSGARIGGYAVSVAHGTLDI